MANLIKWESTDNRNNDITQRVVNLDAVADITTYKGSRNAIRWQFISGATVVDEFQGDSGQSNVDYIMRLVLNDKASND